MIEVPQELILGVGIDVIEIDRATEFYKQHHQRLGELFSKSEISFINGKPSFGIRNAVLRMALILASKEALYKSLSVSFSGLTAFFEDIVILPGAHKLHGKLRKPLLKIMKKKMSFNLHYQIQPRFVMVTCEAFEG